METFLKRNYEQTGKQTGKVSEKKVYPFWDYRSRRGSECTHNSTSSGVSSCSSSEAGVRGTGMLCDSIREEWYPQPATAATKQNSMKGTADMMSLRKALPSTGPPSPAMSVTFMDSAERPNDILDLYNPILQWIDKDLTLFKSADHNDVMDDVTPPKIGGTLDMPSLAIIVFLQEEEMIGDDRLSKAKQYFSSEPWKFHHSEWVSAYHIQAYEYNSHDYYLPADDLPLCSVRQIHCGGEHLRVVRFVTSHNWQDTINLYKLLLGEDPAFVKLDFCVFTLESHQNFDVQFAIKKLPRGVVPRHSGRAVLTIRIPDITSLVPLLPVTCTHLGESLWTTRDLDGNQILLDVIPKDIWATNKLNNIRATEVRPNRLCPRVEVTQTETGLIVSDHPRKSSHREHRYRRAKPPRSNKNKFIHSGQGSSFRPVHKHRHQRTDSGFIEGPRNDILTDIAIDAIHKLGNKASFFSSEVDTEDSPPDSPWESQSSTSNSDVHLLSPGGPSLQGVTLPSGMLDLPSSDWSPNHESGFGDASDLESIREYPIDCSGLMSENDGDKDSLSDSPHGGRFLTTHKTLDNLAADWSARSDSDSVSEQSVKISPYIKEKSNTTDTGQIHKETAQSPADEIDSATDKGDESGTLEEVNSFLESLKQREIRRNYASRIGAHGTLLSSNVDSDKKQFMEINPDHLQTPIDVTIPESIPQRINSPGRTKLTPPPVPPKPRFIPIDPYRSERVQNGINPPPVSALLTVKSKVPKRVTFNDFNLVSERSLETYSEDCENDDEPLGFWI